VKCPAAVKSWRKAWGEFVPFLDYDAEIQKIICTTNAIESLNARCRLITNEGVVAV
jgi:putative transposase